MVGELQRQHNDGGKLFRQIQITLIRFKSVFSCLVLICMSTLMNNVLWLIYTDRPT